MEAELLAAARAGDAARVERCVESGQGAHVDCVNSDGDTPLLLAAAQGHTGVAIFLLARHAAVNRAGRKGDTPLIVASSRGHIATVKLLFVSGAIVDHLNHARETALFHAALGGFLSTVEFLITARATIDITNGDGDTALLAASRQGHTAVVEQLIRYGANVNHANCTNATALMFASLGGHVSTVETLLSANAKVDHLDRAGTSALLLAAKSGCVSIVDKLLAAGARIDLADKFGDTALTLACQNGHTAIVVQLIANGAAVDYVKPTGSTVLMLATYGGSVRTVRALLEAGASLEIANKQCQTALMIARSNDQHAIAELLAEYEGSAEATFAAIVRGDIAALLKTVDKHKNARGVNDSTPLSMAAKLARVDAVQVLVERHANVHDLDASGWTPLHWACQGGSAATVKILLDHGVDVNAQDLEGVTGLTLASTSGKSSIVQLLLQHGATVGPESLAESSVDFPNEMRTLLKMYHNLQQYNERCVQLLSAADAAPTANELGGLVPLMTSAYDLRLFVSLVSVAVEAGTVNETERASVISSALSHVVAAKLVFDDHACVFFKLVLDHCRTCAWLRPADIHLLDRQAEKVNTESAEWVGELQREIHDHRWRLTAHEQGLRRLVEGITQVHTMVQDNRAAIRTVQSRVSHLRSQVVEANKLMNQLVSHGNRITGHVHELRKRLTCSENNLLAVAEGLQTFRNAYVSRLDQEEKTQRMKRISGLVASVAGFVIAPVLKEAFDVVIDLTNPVEIFRLAYSESDIVGFVAESTTEHALVPLVETALEKLMIPKDEFESLLREDIAIQHPEILAECKERGLSLMDGLLHDHEIQYMKSLEPSLVQDIVEVDLVLSELRRGAAAALSSQGVSSYRVVSSAPSFDGILDNQDLEQQHGRAQTVEKMSSESASDDNNNHPLPSDKNSGQFNGSGAKLASADDVLGSADPVGLPGTRDLKIDFEDAEKAMPYHVAVRDSDGQLAKFRDLLASIPSDIDDTERAMRICFPVASRESLCAAEYAYCLGYRAVGDLLASAHTLPRDLNKAPARSVKLLDDVDDFPYICIVDETQGDVDEWEVLCDLIHEEDHALDAQAEADVVRDVSEMVSWSAAEYASHLGYVDIVTHLLKEKHRTMSMRDKIRMTRDAKSRQQQHTLSSMGAEI